jgi:uncharacterized membrane protein YfcA
LIVLAVVGFFAQLVDGALGMAYGVSATTLLLTVGIAPAVASASVHISEVATTAVSGVSHWRFGNVDWSKVLWLALPGGLGAFFGALVLSSLAPEVAAPIVAVFLFVLGVYILMKFAFRAERPVVERHVPRALLSPLGLFAGFMDAMGGGGWGPISTPTLLSSGRMQPRKVVGTVDASEFVVAVSATAGFLLAPVLAPVLAAVGLGGEALALSDLSTGLIVALLVGGVIAAPLAAWIVRHLNARVLGTAVGGVILLTNTRTFLNSVGLESLLVPLLLVIAAVWVVTLYFAITAARREGQGVIVAEPTAEPVA